MLQEKWKEKNKDESVEEQETSTNKKGGCIWEKYT